MNNARPWHALLAVSIPLAEAIRGTRLDPTAGAKVDVFYAHLAKFLKPDDRAVMLDLDPGFSIYMEARR